MNPLASGMTHSSDDPMLPMLALGRTSAEDISRPEYQAGVTCPVRANRYFIEQFTEPAALDIAAIIAGHAPEQEWEAKEKALRELCFNLRAGTQYQTVKDYHIAFKIEAILNREQEKQP